MNTNPPENYSVALMRLLGTDFEIACAIRERGITAPPEATIHGWRKRCSVPSRFQILLAQIAIDKGKIARLEDLTQMVKNP